MALYAFVDQVGTHVVMIRHSDVSAVRLLLTYTGLLNAFTVNNVLYYWNGVVTNQCPRLLSYIDTRCARGGGGGGRYRPRSDADAATQRVICE